MNPINHPLTTGHDQTAPFAALPPPPERVLWLDIGNTRVKHWLTEAGQVQSHGAELHLQSPLDLLRGLRVLFAGLGARWVALSSVLDADTNLAVLHLLQSLAVPVHAVQVQAEHRQMRSRYDPTRLGMDRWLQVLAVAADFPEACVVGCGTALTIDVLDGGVHQGGYILPSLHLQREALNHGTRQIRIPDGSLSELSVGRNTHDAVHHGIVLGLVGAIEKTLHHQPHRPLFLTGGDAALLAGFLQVRNRVQVVPDLLLAGLLRYFS